FFAGRLNSSSASAHTLPAILAVGVIVLLPVAILIVYKMRTGAWTTVDASQKHERSTLYAVSLGGLLGLVLHFALHDYDAAFVRGSLGTFGLLLCAWLGNRWVKASLHAAFAAMAAAVLIAHGSIAGWVMLALLPALGWSRIKLQRHTWPELAYG